MRATAWTVFTGDKPEAMEIEILGVLRGARGPGQDMILAQLHGAKPEYTGVVAGMSGSPVYIGDRLLGSLSYRIGQFSKDPIAGITPIEQMLEVRDLPICVLCTQNEQLSVALEPRLSGAGNDDAAAPFQAPFQAMETPLVMGGFSPEAIRLWQKKMAGTGLETVAAGGMGGAQIRLGTRNFCRGDCQPRAGIGGERATGARRPGDSGHLHGNLHRSPSRCWPAGTLSAGRASFPTHDDQPRWWLRWLRR